MVDLQTSNSVQISRCVHSASLAAFSVFSKSNELAEKLLRHVPRFGFDFRRSWLARDASLRDLRDCSRNAGFAGFRVKTKG